MYMCHFRFWRGENSDCEVLSQYRELCTRSESWVSQRCHIDQRHIDRKSAHVQRVRGLLVAGFVVFVVVLVVLVLVMWIEGARIWGRTSTRIGLWIQIED